MKYLFWPKSCAYKDLLTWVIVSWLFSEFKRFIDNQNTYKIATYTDTCVILKWLIKYLYFIDYNLNKENNQKMSTHIKHPKSHLKCWLSAELKQIFMKDWCQPEPPSGTAVMRSLTSALSKRISNKYFFFSLPFTFCEHEFTKFKLFWHMQSKEDMKVLQPKHSSLKWFPGLIFCWVQ